MKLRLFMALLLALMLSACAAAAQTLPGVDVFSPGLVRVSEKLAAGESVQMQAQLSVENMAYARDLSLLKAMLSGATFRYAGEGGAVSGSDSLTVERGGETVLSLGMARGDGQAQILVNGEAFALDLTGGAQALQAIDWADGAALLERQPLLALCEALEALRGGDTLALGFSAQDAFSVARTYSDDGERLTKIDIQGQIARGDEAPWAAEGYVRQPGGRSPKDTLEITLTQDEDNYLEISGSAQRKSEITRKNKAGEASADITLKVAGKIAGSRISARLTVYLRNAWTADGDTLRERVSMSATLGYTDNTPGRRMQRLNDLSIKLKTVTTLTTAEAGNEVIDLDETISLTAVFDDNTFLDVSADCEAAVGGRSGEALNAAPAENAAQTASAETVAAALEEAAARMAQLIYGQLSESQRASIEKGL